MITQALRAHVIVAARSLHVVIFQVFAEKLIQAIRKYPVLYDQSLKEYRDTVLQNIADSNNIIGFNGTLILNFS